MIVRIWGFMDPTPELNALTLLKHKMQQTKIKFSENTTVLEPRVSGIGLLLSLRDRTYQLC